MRQMSLFGHPDLLAIVLFHARSPLVTLACRSMRHIFPEVCTAVIASGDVEFISELTNRELVVKMFRQNSQIIVDWCHRTALNIVHLVHPDIDLDYEMCDLVIRQTDGFAYEFIPFTLRQSNIDLAELALRVSDCRVFLLMFDSMKTRPDICRLCLELLEIHGVIDDDGHFDTHHAIQAISLSIPRVSFPQYDNTNPLYHKRTNLRPALTLTRSLASEDVGWRHSNTADA